MADFVADPSRSRDYTVEAHWALYVENYLEGLHIPFVHPGLMQALDLAAPTHLTEALRTNMSGGKTVAQLLSEVAREIHTLKAA